jgi:hypothetical protein
MLIQSPTRPAKPALPAWVGFGNASANGPITDIFDESLPDRLSDWDFELECGGPSANFAYLLAAKPQTWQTILASLQQHFRWPRTPIQVQIPTPPDIHHSGLVDIRPVIRQAQARILAYPSDTVPVVVNGFENVFNRHGQYQNAGHAMLQFLRDGMDAGHQEFYAPFRRHGKRLLFLFPILDKDPAQYDKAVRSAATAHFKNGFLILDPHQTWLDKEKAQRP